MIFLFFVNLIIKEFLKISICFLIISLCSAQRAYYKGEWKNNRHHGNGNLVDVFGNKYVGEFAEGVKHGKGILEYNNGAKFEGQFVNGKRSEGTYYYSNGTKYIGKWKRGKKHGDGIFVDKSSIKEIQFWSNGKKQDNLKEELVLKPSKETGKETLIINDKLSDIITKEQIPILTTADDLFRIGKDSFFGMDYDKAIINLSNSIEMGYDSNDAFYFLAKSYEKKKKFQDAIRIFKRSLENNSKDTRALFNKSIAHFYVDELDSAITYMIKVIELDSSHINAYFNLGGLYLKKNDSTASIFYYQKVFFDDRNLARQYYGYPDSTRKYIDSKDQIRSYENEVTYSPDLPRGYYNLGIYNYDINNQDKALKLFIQSNILDEDYTHPIHAIKYLANSGNEKAIEYLKEIGE